MDSDVEKHGLLIRTAEVLLRPVVTVLTRRDWRGQEWVPKTGGVILVANHISMTDPMIIGHYVYDLPRMPHFLAKESLFQVPVFGSLLRRVGQIPVRRGSADAAHALDAATAAVRAGAAVIIYPEGTCTKDPDLWPMRGKTGVARLALATQAPVVPLAQWGAQRFLHPTTRKIRIWRQPITVAAGPPIDLSRYYGRPVSAPLLREITDLIMARLTDDVAKVRDADGIV